MRAVLLIVTLAACGRIGFGDQAQPSDAQIDSALLVLFTFDTPPGNTIPNAAKPSLSGRCIDQCPKVVPGKRGNAYLFQDPANGIAISDDPMFRITTGTIAMWARIDTLPDPGGYVMFANKPLIGSEANSWEMFIANSTADGMTVYGGGDSVSATYASQQWSMSAGTWVHVATTWSPTKIQMFVNGVLVGTTSGLEMVFDASDVLIGVDKNATGYENSMVGAIDDVRLYSRELTQAEIAAL